MRPRPASTRLGRAASARPDAPPAPPDARPRRAPAQLALAGRAVRDRLRGGEAALRACFGEDVPLKRAGQPVEIAHSYVFLASEGGTYMTGQVLHPNGGTIVGG